MAEQEKKDSIFRQKALTKVSSPEEFDRCLVVTRPGVWFALAAVIILLAGVIVWGFLGHIETTYQMAVIAVGDDAYCYVPLDKKDAVLKVGSIKINNVEYKVRDAGYAPSIVTDEDLEAIMAAYGNLSVGQQVLPLKVEAADLDEGVFYTGEVVIETVRPISFIIN